MCFGQGGSAAQSLTLAKSTAYFMASNLSWPEPNRDSFRFVHQDCFCHRKSVNGLQGKGVRIGVRIGSFLFLVDFGRRPTTWPMRHNDRRDPHPDPDPIHDAVIIANDCCKNCCGLRLAKVLLRSVLAPREISTTLSVLKNAGEGRRNLCSKIWGYLNSHWRWNTLTKAFIRVCLWYFNGRLWYYDT